MFAHPAFRGRNLPNRPGSAFFCPFRPAHSPGGGAEGVNVCCGIGEAVEPILALGDLDQGQPPLQRSGSGWKFVMHNSA